MFKDKTYEYIRNEILSNIDLNIAKNEGSILNSLVSGTALAHASFYSMLQEIYEQSFLINLTEESLDNRIKEFGLSRKQGQKASGYITVTGDNDVTIEYMDEFKLGNRVYYVVHNTGVITISNNTVTILVEAEDIGHSYNATHEDIFTTEIPGIEKATGFSPIRLGTDNESDEELKSRFFYAQIHKGTSGNIDDYINWSLEVEGVKNAKVIPLWNGNGTVKVIVTSSNNQSVGSEVLNNVKTYLNKKKPIGATVTVETPTPLTIDIKAIVEVEKDVDINDIKEHFIDYLSSYLTESIKEITYTKVAAILSNITGVVDFKELKINNNSTNITLPENQIGSVGTVTLTKGTV